MPLHRKHSPSVDREPMGIIIADGGLPETTTRFLAYVWGPVPDEEDAEVELPAAEAPPLLVAATV